MELQLPTTGLDRYKSASQRARVGTESWGASNFFCPVCDSPRLDVAPHGTATLDYSCPKCSSPFQLKSQSKPFGAKILDSAYSQMKRAILTDRTPNLYVLHYDLSAWAVRTVILIPHFAFVLSAIEVRPPLAPTARRAGWIGCNILLHKIPADARIPFKRVASDEWRVVSVEDSVNTNAQRHERGGYGGVRRLAALAPFDFAQGRQDDYPRRIVSWTLDVLNVVRAVVEEREAGRAEATPLHNTFTLEQVYAHVGELGKRHPSNRNIEPKIRQQLQVLRDDLGLIEFLTPGHYRLK